MVDFKDQIKRLGEKVVKLKDQIGTEEATKNAFIMPFINVMGYDVFNPLEVVPEFIADIGIKKGEKVDYCILKDGEPIILIECKHYSEKLDPHSSQLFRYFHTTKAKFGLLTNGIEYRWYTDLVVPNKMDDQPFFTLSIDDIKDAHVEELKKFHKSYFNLDDIINTASELKFTGELKALILQEMNNPTPEFVRYFAKTVYPGVVTQKVLDQFTALLKKSFAQVVNDSITDRLKSALKTEETEVQPATPAGETVLTSDPKVVTTEEELDAFRIVRSICRKEAPVSKIVHRDAQSYFAILFEDNNRKPICRLYFNTSKKYIGLFDDKKAEVRKEIMSLDDIFNFSDELCATVKSYQNSKSEQ